MNFIQQPYSESGLAAPFLAICLAGLFATVALAVNSARTYFTHRTMSYACTAGAQAGAEYMSAPGVEARTESGKAQVIAKARQVTLDYLAANRVNEKPENLEVILEPAANPERVLVRGKTDMPLLFAKFIEGSSSPRVDGIAGAMTAQLRVPTKFSFFIDNTPSITNFSTEAGPYVSVPCSDGKWACLKGDQFQRAVQTIASTMDLEDAAAAFSEGIRWADLTVGMNTKQWTDLLSNAGSHWRRFQYQAATAYINGPTLQNVSGMNTSPKDTPGTYSIANAVNSAVEAIKQKQAQIHGSDYRETIPARCVNTGYFGVCYPETTITKYKMETPATKQDLLVLVSDFAMRKTDLDKILLKVNEFQALGGKVLAVGVGGVVPETYCSLKGDPFACSKIPGPPPPPPFGNVACGSLMCSSVLGCMQHCADWEKKHASHYNNNSLNELEAFNPAICGILADDEKLLAKYGGYPGNTAPAAGAGGKCLQNPTTKEILEALEGFKVFPKDKARSKPKLIL